MTKTKDPRLKDGAYKPCTCPDAEGITECAECGGVLYTSIPKRCDECRWWKEISASNHDCNNHNVSIILPPPDFYCKYWEKKEE
jgi:hypothetical protein